MTYTELSDAIQAYTENISSAFVAEIPVFVTQAEQRIYNSVQIAYLRKNVTGQLTAGNQYLACPDDFLSAYSIAVYSSAGSPDYQFLIDKDVDRKSTRLNSSHIPLSRMPSSA